MNCNRTYKVAGLQMNCKYLEIKSNCNKVEQFIRMVVKNEAKIICLSETFK